MSPTELMNQPRASHQLVILVAEDDEDDRERVRAAFDDAYAGLVDAMRNFADYWFELVALPQP